MRRLSLLLLILSCSAALAADQQFDRPTGLVPPKDLAVRARVQNAKSAPLVNRLLAAREAAGIAGPSPKAKSFDYRTLGVGLGVRNQLTCRSCCR